jgi:hypothetical protein
MDPEQTPEEELSMNEKIAILMEDLPVPVQNFLRGPERDAVSSELSTKYNLNAHSYICSWACTLPKNSYRN